MKIADYFLFLSHWAYNQCDIRTYKHYSFVSFKLFIIINVFYVRKIISLFQLRFKLDIYHI